MNYKSIILGLSISVLLFGCGDKQSPAKKTTYDAQQIQILQQKSEKGDSKAQYALAKAYLNGEGVKKDYVESLKLFKKVTDKELVPHAMFFIGYINATGGYGVEKDESNAVKYFKIAAEKGNAPAQYKLGLAYRDGSLGLNKDDKESEKWLRLAANQGHKLAQKEVLKK